MTRTVEIIDSHGLVDWRVSLSLPVIPKAGYRKRLLKALSQRGGRAGVRVVELERQRDELIERGPLVGLLPRPPQPGLDRLTVALGEMAEHVSLLVLHAALDRHVVAEHLPYGFPERLEGLPSPQSSTSTGDNLACGPRNPARATRDARPC